MSRHEVLIGDRILEYCCSRAGGDVIPGSSVNQRCSDLGCNIVVADHLACIGAA